MVVCSSGSDFAGEQGNGRCNLCVEGEGALVFNCELLLMNGK